MDSIWLILGLHHNCKNRQIVPNLRLYNWFRKNTSNQKQLKLGNRGLLQECIEDN